MPANPSRGCAPEGDFGIGKGADGQNTYRCVGGKWHYSMKTTRAAELIKQAQDAKAAANAAASTTTTTTTEPETTTTAPPETTTTTTQVPVVPASIEGCYYSPLHTTDIYVVHSDKKPEWAYLGGVFASKDASCTPNPPTSLRVFVAAGSQGEADSRCNQLFNDAKGAGDIVDPDVAALSGLYDCGAIA